MRDTIISENLEALELRECLICGSSFYGIGNYCIHCVMDRSNNMPPAKDSKSKKEYIKKGD